MNPSKLIGLALLVAGVVLQPIGWAYVHWLMPISLLMIALGIAVLLIASRGLQQGATEGMDPARSGRGLPGDIHGYSGQHHGGRSTSWESHHTSGGAVGSAGDGGGGD